MNWLLVFLVYFASWRADAAAAGTYVIFVYSGIILAALL